MLVENPNPDDPLSNYPMCLEAAEFFRQNTMDDLREKYGGKEGEDAGEDAGDDDIIIVDD